MKPISDAFMVVVGTRPEIIKMALVFFGFEEKALNGVFLQIWLLLVVLGSGVR